LVKKNEDVYNENIDFLKELIHIFTNLEIGNGEFIGETDSKRHNNKYNIDNRES